MKEWVQQGGRFIALPFVLPWAVKEEPRDEEEEAKMKAPPRTARKTPGLPKDVSVAELLRELSLTQEEELLFLQLPDTLPGQPPTQDIKPIKTEVQSEDGQMVVIKQEKDRVCSGMSPVKMPGGPGRETAVREAEVCHPSRNVRMIHICSLYPQGTWGFVLQPLLRVFTFDNEIF